MDVLIKHSQTLLLVCYRLPLRAKYSFLIAVKFISFFFFLLHLALISCYWAIISGSMRYKMPYLMISCNNKLNPPSILFKCVMEQYDKICILVTYMSK